ncbi:uncharacterized protein [Nicotiana tomentosiformis]|uniref:uncharacterized protein n=1 Tax=Nicotiana tomentosiformis TaxID=4098 RepID=UPI00388CBCB8
MKIYAKSYDVKGFEKCYKKGNYPLPEEAQPPTDPEDIDEYTDEQMTVVQVNAKAQNLLYNTIGGEEYEKIFSRDTTKEIWDKLEVTYGTSKVKTTRINMLVHDYELFQMKEGESIEEIFARFSKIISDLKAFGKPYSSGDQTSQEEKKKTVAFKSTTEGPENDIDDDPEALEEEIAMVSRNMDRLMRRYRNTRRERMPSRRTRQYNEQNRNDGKCYECGRYGDVQVECPDLKRKDSRGFNKNKSFESWSDEDSSEHEEMANLCFMTILENDMNNYSGCWTDENISDDECKKNTENYFMARESQKMLNELRRLNRKKKYWELKLEVCEIERDVLQDEVQELQMQLNDMRKSTSHSSVKSNQTTFKSTEKRLARAESIGDKNLFKEVTKINGGNVKFNDDSKGKIVGTGTVPFGNNCDIIEVYLVDGLNYNLLSISQLCNSGYEVKFKKTGCAIEDETGKIILPVKSRSFRVYNKHTLFVEESMHVIFDENNFMAKKGIIISDEDTNQEVSQTNKLQKSTDIPAIVTESTNEPVITPAEPQKESTTSTVET